jgi:hypothetical protein
MPLGYRNIPEPAAGENEKPIKKQKGVMYAKTAQSKSKGMLQAD